MTKPLKVFFISAALLSVLTCVGGCMLFGALPRGTVAYGTYLLFLTLAVFGGALILALSTALICRREDIELRMIRSRSADLERTLKNLEEDANRREEFIASFAHELKTPLTAIIGYADMLRSKDMAPKPRFTAAGYIFSEGKRLEALSLKLMDIIVIGKQEFEMKRADPGVLIRSVAAVTVPSLSNLNMILDMHWEKGEISIEPDLFKTLLINLVDNARKASKHGDHIALLGKAEEGGYAFYVQDHGRGMKPEELKRITEPFYMIDKSRSRAQNGAGLGLALCQRIADLHGTELQYTSAPGEGTTVRIFLKGGAAE